MQQSRLVIRATGLSPRPWPNGLGITRDIHGSIDTGWLISVADLTKDAAFSHFPGCDRVFTLIQGGGVILTLDGQFAMPCRPFVPAHFPGDRPTFCSMGDGPARAFNLFVARNTAAYQVSVHMIAASHTIQAPENTVAIYCAAGTITAQDETLHTGDTAVGTGAASIQSGEAAATAIIVQIDSAPGPGVG